MSCNHPWTKIVTHSGWTSVVCGVCQTVLSQQKTGK